ncbi:uracil-xanthine permease family protein [Pluralibacter gergoviae]|uniref:Nucleobase:cation symporter-2 family protein n=1 Tax=Pluralibacter gergoviae TaxID=61647 RepID=A0AAW8HL12_PLUGE|nr:nucleobase:cation symporter-2 family protein [Pluralibacter gergoviae]AVR03349.1 purine permease [Pluralibacter gergoviae]EKT9639990.1 purine permease [Pluralibacter gergoviae]EKV0928082.1 purine permease [Pluralibacter gergoviae]EKV3543112.1 purine permease [Pluralibacter gergoviae]EKV6246017.1 purine permease [Pluralibacter gergoviae]
MSAHEPSELIYGLEDKPAPLPAFLTALQHVMASLVGIITPPLIVSSALGLDAYLPWLISMSLMVSGAGTFLQARRPFGIGAGMICLQGTSFAFLGVILAAGFTVKSRGGGPEQIMAMIFGLTLIAAFIPVVVSRFLGQLRRVITPLVSGTVLCLIGISLIKVSITDWGGGHGAKDFGAPGNLLLGLLTLMTIVLFSRAGNRWLRLGAVILGIAFGCLLAALSGKLHWQPFTHSWVALPQPLRFGFDFDYTLFLPFALISLICILEAVGDLTANCLLSRRPIEGDEYVGRLRGGILADGASCVLAALFSALPSTTFAQNNGVIQMTGVASRRVGLWIGALLALLGLFPIFGAAIQQIPAPVLGGATLVMFGSVLAAGIRIMTQSPLTRRDMLIIAVSFGIGLGVEAEPAFLSQLPPVFKNLFGSAVASGGITAMLLNLLLPGEGSERPSVQAAAAKNRAPR